LIEKKYYYLISGVFEHPNTPKYSPDEQWLKWFCEAGGGSPDEARLEQTPYPF